MSDTTLFDAARALKRERTGNPGAGLIQSEVDALNAIIEHWQPPPRVDPIPDAYYPVLAAIESGNRPYIKARTSSGSGLYQFLRATWEAEGGAWGEDEALAFGGLRPSVEEQLVRVMQLTEKNAAVLRAAAVPINKASLYAAHFLGAHLAAKIISSGVGAHVDLLVSPEAVNANPSILKGKTVGQFLEWLHGKTGDWAR